MTTGLQIALLGGALAGLGVAILLWQLAPAEPDLVDVVHRYSPAGAKARAAQAAAAAPGTAEQLDFVDRLGIWSIKRLPAECWGTEPEHHDSDAAGLQRLFETPTKELSLLRIPLHHHCGDKVRHAIIGLLIAPLLTYLFTVMGLPVPVLIPTAGSLALAVVMFFVPDFDVRLDARRARVEFTRALVAYTELVALERLRGSGPLQALAAAADVGDSWVFRRIGQELARSRWSGLAPWDALHALAGELGLPELDDVADIMRLSKDGGQVYTNLRARAAGLRSALLSDELAKANAANDRMSMPMTLLGVVFMALLVTPVLLRIMSAT